VGLSVEASKQAKAAVVIVRFGCDGLVRQTDQLLHCIFLLPLYILSCSCTYLTYLTVVSWVYPYSQSYTSI
jgi:hypothetical protein